MKDFHHIFPENGRSSIHFLAACPMCQTAYQPLTTRIIAERDETHLLFLECRHCGIGMVAMVTTDPSGLNSIGAVTDLTSGEILPSSTDVPVSPDDVLDLHVCLHQQPSLHQILRREKATS